MAAKKKPAAKKSTKKQAKSKKNVGRKATRAKKTPTKKTAKKKLPAKKAAPRRSAAKTSGKKRAAATAIAPKKEVRGSQPTSRAFSRESRSARLGEESGDLQGLSRREESDSESVDELLEEGNAFEAGIVQGVEDAGNAQGQEVHTHEVPEDDVPEEYLDED
jgi:hypothetical protein